MAEGLDRLPLILGRSNRADMENDLQGRPGCLPYAFSDMLIKRTVHLGEIQTSLR